MRNTSNSLIDTGLRIYDRDAEVGKEQGLSRSLRHPESLRASLAFQLVAAASKVPSFSRK
jgi:hypothetical protein